jgi:hypothetical protein
VQVHGNRSKGAAEALLPPGKLATVPAGPALHRQASHRSSTPSSPASSYNQGIRYSKKYSTEPPGPRKQPWFEFLVSSSFNPAAAAGCRSSSLLGCLL